MKINSVLQFFQVFRVSKIVHPFLQVFTRSDHKRYFPRWNVEETGAGYYWDMYIVCTICNIWFIGGSLSFESAHHVIGYNQLLLAKMKK